MGAVTANDTIPESAADGEIRQFDMCPRDDVEVPVLESSTSTTDTDETSPVEVPSETNESSTDLPATPPVVRIEIDGSPSEPLRSPSIEITPQFDIGALISTMMPAVLEMLGPAISGNNLCSGNSKRKYTYRSLGGFRHLFVNHLKWGESQLNWIPMISTFTADDFIGMFERYDPAYATAVALTRMHGDLFDDT